jgi:hypothetical protein
VYVLDNTGTQNNDLIGDCRIETLYPNGAGNYAQLSANGAGTNYGCVNEHPADDDTTYVPGTASVGSTATLLEIRPAPSTPSTRFR